MNEAQVVAAFLFGIIIYEVVKLSVRGFFRRTVETEYVTTERCRECRDECTRMRTIGATTVQENLRDLGKNLDMQRGIMLVIAVKVGVDDATLQNLAMRRRDD